MKPRRTFYSLLVVTLALLLSALTGCASGGYVEAKPTSAADLAITTPQVPTLE